jgi:hypothetical protein
VKEVRVHHGLQSPQKKKKKNDYMIVKNMEDIFGDI